MSKPYISGLLYPDMKAQRAAAHLKELHSHLDAFRANPYTISEQDDLERGVRIFSIALNRMTPHIPVLIGEYAYTLRSALDHLAWQLSLLSGRTPRRSTSFPIHAGDGIKDRERFMRSTWDIPCEPLDIIKSLQPHLRGKGMKKDPLWQLNKLCNLDKHVTVGYGHTVLRFTFYYAHGADTTQPPYEVGKDASPCRVFIPLARVTEVKIKPEPPDLIFGKPIDAPGADFELSEADIKEIHRFVRYDVFPRFAKFFPPFYPVQL